MIKATVTRSRTLKGSSVVPKLAAGIQAGLMAMGDVLLRESRRLVPIDTTVLYEDGHVRTEGSGFGSVVVVGYGTIGKFVRAHSPHEHKMVTREPAFYAEWVHEGINPHNGQPYNFHNGQMEFLRIPAQDPIVWAEMVAVFRAAVGV